MKYIEALRKGIEDLMEADDKVVMIGEDIGKPYGGAFKVSKGLEDKYPEQIISTPMSESALTGITVGMALNGQKPILEIMFGDFITLCCDQIINHASKFKFLFDKDLNMVLRTPMGGYRGYGATHSQSIEKIFFGVPYINVFAANILNDPGKLLKKAVNYKEPVIFIENKLDYAKEIISDNNKFIIKHNEEHGISEVNIKGETDCDGYIITYGGMVELSLNLIWDIFLEEEKVLKVIVLDMISPIKNDLLKYLSGDKEIYIIEEQIIEGGFGAEIARSLLENRINTKKFKCFGAKNEVIGASKSLEFYVLPDKEKIFKEIVGE